MDGSDAAEIERARRGDQEAFRTLVERHGRRVFHLAYRMTGNEHDAEDVAQETFLKAWRRLAQFESRADFGSWLYRIAANNAYDILRGRARDEGRTRASGDEPEQDPLRQLPSREPGAERAVFGLEVQHRIRKAMARLSPLERSAFVLRHFEQRSLEEIGATLGLDTGATKHSVFRAVRKMREALRPLLATEGP